MGRTFASLRHFNYRTWFFTALIANIGTWMQIVAQDWLVLAELTEDDAFAGLPAWSSSPSSSPPRTCPTPLG